MSGYIIWSFAQGGSFFEIDKNTRQRYLRWRRIIKIHGLKQNYFLSTRRRPGRARRQIFNQAIIGKELNPVSACAGSQSGSKSTNEEGAAG